MPTNYTPINVDEFKKKFLTKKTFGLNTVLLLIGTLTALVLIFMLFVLIQKRMQPQVTPNQIEVNSFPTRIPSPTTIPTEVPTSVPSPTVAATQSATLTPAATPSGTLTTTPTVTTTASPSPTTTP